VLTRALQLDLTRSLQISVRRASPLPLLRHVPAYDVPDSCSLTMQVRIHLSPCRPICHTSQGAWARPSFSVSRGRVGPHLCRPLILDLTGLPALGSYLPTSLPPTVPPRPPALPMTSSLPPTTLSPTSPTCPLDEVPSAFDFVGLCPTPVSAASTGVASPTVVSPIRGAPPTSPLPRPCRPPRCCPPAPRIGVVRRRRVRVLLPGLCPPCPRPPAWPHPLSPPQSGRAPSTSPPPRHCWPPLRGASRRHRPPSTRPGPGQVEESRETHEGHEEPRSPEADAEGWADGYEGRRRVEGSGRVPAPGSRRAVPVGSRRGGARGEGRPADAPARGGQRRRVRPARRCRGEQHTGQEERERGPLERLEGVEHGHSNHHTTPVPQQWRLASSTAIAFYWSRSPSWPPARKATSSLLAAHSRRSS
jgi:hypothetical protein